MADNREPIAPNPSRWKPSNDSASINVPGLDKDASVSDQIEQIEQLITIKLQVGLVLEQRMRGLTVSARI